MIAFQRPEILFLIVPALIIIFFLTKADLIRFRNRKEKEDYNRSKRWLRAFVMLTRLIIAACLIIALAGPYTIDKKMSEGNPRLKILLDRSGSFDMFDRDVGEGMKERLNLEIPVTVREMGEHNRSALGDSIMASIEGDDSVLLITDGNNNHGKDLGSVALFAAMLNSTINVLDISPINSDTRVMIAGPHKTTSNTETAYEVYVDTIGEARPYTLVVAVDGEEVINEALSGPEKKTFSKALAQGYHTIEGKIFINDYFPENNIFYKSVKVEPKPKVLLVTSQSSPLASIMPSLYEIRTEQRMPADLSQYSAVVIDDQKAANLDIAQLRDYTIDGNGLAVFGGKSSFDKDSYQESAYKAYEALLPVTVGAGKPKEKKEVNVVIVIDISGSAGQSFSRGSVNTVQDIEKALALSILGDLRKEDQVGIIAFNTNAYTVAELAPLTEQNLPQLEDKVTRLKWGGGTLISSGIEAAIDMLSEKEGSKNIILISDGVTGGLPWDEIRAVEGAAFGGIKTYTVGVGSATNSVHMKNLAEAGNGMYFEPEETQTIKIIFGGSEEQEKKEMSRLEVLNKHHFITTRLPLNAEITGFNFVIPKQSAMLLVSTAQNNPVVSVWRFGLGRIAVVSTDNGNAWSGQVYGQKNSLLVARAINWAVGDLSRKKEFDVDIKDATLGEQLEVNVKSKGLPVHEGLNFSKTGENTYLATITPKEQGFYRYFDAVAAVNYPEELGNLGVNPDLESIARITGGQVFRPEQVQEIAEKVRQDSKVIKTETISHAWIFLSIALAVFLLEIAVRRIAENKALNK